MTNLERTWWFAALAGGFSAFSARLVMDYAGIPSPSGAAQWLVFFFCMFGIWRVFAFAVWSAILLARPKSPLLDSAPGAGPRF